MSTESSTAAPARKGGKLLFVLLALALVAAGGGGAYWWMSQAPVEAAPREVPLSERGLVTFEPFMVNLADGGGNRFLKVSLQLVVEAPRDAETISSTPVVVSRLRSDILELLTVQTAPELVTPEGKADLKTSIRERAGSAIEPRKVIDVLFSEFVVQF